MKRELSPSFIRTGQSIERGLERLPELYHRARELCGDLFVAEETRTFDALYDYVPLGFVDGLRNEIARKLACRWRSSALDRFSIHGCGPVGLHDDSFRYPQYYFAMVVAHSGALGLVDAHSVALRHEVGEIILLDPRRKHGLVREGGPRRRPLLRELAQSGVRRRQPVFVPGSGRAPFRPAGTISQGLNHPLPSNPRLTRPPWVSSLLP